MPTKQISKNLFWISSHNDFVIREKGEVKPRPNSVAKKLIEKGYKLIVLIPYNSDLLPKSKPAASRTTTLSISLGEQSYQVSLLKLTRGAINPIIYMVQLPSLDPALKSALFAKSAIELAKSTKKTIHLFHAMGWESALLPLYLELEKNHSKRFSQTRTFFTVDSIQETGNFSPAFMSMLGIPEDLFHPDGLEFYGHINFLKAGLIFSDGIGWVEKSSKSSMFPSLNGWTGVVESVSPKIRRWVSARSVKSHLDAYKELLNLKNIQPILPGLLSKIQRPQVPIPQLCKTEQIRNLSSQMIIWGPPLPGRYNVNAISLLVQSPTKAYAYWEYAGQPTRFGLVLENTSKNKKTILSHDSSDLGEFWFSVNPGQYFTVEFVAFKSKTKYETLMRSRTVFVPRNSSSLNKTAIFMDTQNKNRLTLRTSALPLGKYIGGGSDLRWISVSGTESSKGRLSS